MGVEKKRKPPEKRNLILRKRLRFPFLVLGAKVLVTAFAAAGCADCIACVTVHAYFDVKEPGFGLRELYHNETLLSALITKL